MKLWVGLGNPEPGMARQRHNIGFMALDTIAIRHGFTPWRQRFKGLVAEGTIAGERILGLKPQTYMNVSGESVQAAAGFFKLPPDAITAWHDELDLAPGKVRVKQGGGHAGHNGLRSIHQHLGEAYGRVRIGIGHPGHKDRVAGYVLSDFAKAEANLLDDMIRGISDGAPALAEGDAGRFQNAVAARTAPARNSGTAQSAPAGAATPALVNKAPEPAPEPQGLSDKLRALGARFR